MSGLMYLESKQQRLKKQIADHLDILIGSISTKGPKRPGFNLTFKVNQITYSRHIRKETLPEVRRMTQRYQKLKKLLQLLSDANWETIKEQSSH